MRCQANSHNFFGHDTTYRRKKPHVGAAPHRKNHKEIFIFNLGILKSQGRPQFFQKKKAFITNSGVSSSAPEEMKMGEVC